MNWYLTKIVFRVLTGGKEHPACFDEQLRVLTASTKHEAFSKARQLGISGEGVVVNVNNDRLIEWKFINVSMLYQLKELLDGAEIGAVTHEPDCADTYIEMIHDKAANIRDGNTLEILQLI